MFNPDLNKHVRYRYKCDHDNKRYSSIHTKNSPFVLKKLKPYLDFQITMKLINYDNDDDFLFGLLRMSKKKNQFQMINGLVTGQITSDEIKMDFLAIEIIKSKELSGSQSIDRNELKRRDNCRLLVCIKCPSKEEQIKSKILRNKNVGILDIDVCPIAGHFENTCPNIFIVHLKKMVPYYPDEVTMVIGDCEFKSISHIKDAMKENLYQSYKFDIHDRFLLNSHSCKLQCKMFGITSNDFTLSLTHLTDQSEVNMPINRENYPSFAKKQTERSVTSTADGLTISNPRTRKHLEQAIMQRKNKLSGETYGDLSKKFENQPTMSRVEPKNTEFAKEDNCCEAIIPISENYSTSLENTTIGTFNETDNNFSAFFSETVQISNLSFDRVDPKNTEFAQQDNSGETMISISENYPILSGEPPNKKVTYEDYYNTPFTPVSENCTTPIPLLDPKSEDAKYLIDNILPSDYQSYNLIFQNPF